MNREQYLEAATAELAPHFAAIGEKLPPVKVSCSWPGGRARKNVTIGQCWSRSASAAGVNEIYISPTMSDSVRVLDILVHELVHAIDDCESGHGAPFGRIARAIGLEGKPSATTAGEALTEKLQAIVAKLGEYPHKAVRAPLAPKKQGTRMIKIECNECGAVFRMSRKHAVNVIACPCCQSEDLNNQAAE